MPLKLVASRNKKTKNLYIRGSHLGVRVDRTSRTDDTRLARRQLKLLKGQIERGEYPPRELPRGQKPTFVSAALAYVKAGRPTRYVQPLADYFKDTPISEIDQAAIDAAAAALVPNGTPMNRTRLVYTPVSAIMHHAGDKRPIRRPKGFQGRIITDWLVPEDAFGIITAADAFDREVGALLSFLLYTGPRISAALELRREDVRLDEGRAWARNQKGQPHMDVRLRADLCERLGEHLASHERHRVFRWHYGSHLIHLLTRAKLGYLGIDCPVRRAIGWREPHNRLEWVTFHSFRHTWATWMRQAGVDIQGLVATGNWRSTKAAARYAHAVAREEWDHVEKLPAMKRGAAG